MQFSSQIGIRKLGEKQFSKAKMSVDQHQIMGILKQWMNSREGIVYNNYGMITHENPETNLLKFSFMNIVLEISTFSNPVVELFRDVCTEKSAVL